MAALKAENSTLDAKFELKLSVLLWLNTVLC